MASDHVKLLQMLFFCSSPATNSSFDMRCGFHNKSTGFKRRQAMGNAHQSVQMVKVWIEMSRSGRHTARAHGWFGGRCSSFLPRTLWFRVF